MKIAGQAAVETLRQSHADLSDLNQSLIAQQEKESAEGYRGAEICRTYRGWSLRHASGLQNFALIRPGIQTLEEAKRIAADWVADDPARRYAFIRNTELSR